MVPAPLDFGCSTQAPITFALPARTLEVASGLEYWICENAKTLRAYLKRVGEVYPLKLAIQKVQIQELPHAVHKKGDHLGETRTQQKSSIEDLLKPALQGNSMGLARVAAGHDLVRASQG